MRIRNLILSLLLLPAFAHAQVVPAQNQVIISPYGGPGYVVSTSTSGTKKLEATSTPWFVNFFANAGTIQNLVVTSCSGCSNIATSSQETSGRVPFWTSTNGTPATLSGGVAGFAWDNTNTRLTSTYASSTALSAVNANFTLSSSTNASSSQISTTNLFLNGLTSGALYAGLDSIVRSAATSTPSNGTGISVTGTGATIGSITITNTAPDQTVVINAGDGIAVSSAYPNFTIYNPFAIATTTNLAQGGVAFFSKISGKTTLDNVGTTTVTANNGLSGSITTLNSGGASNALGLAAIAANTVLGNTTGASAVPTALATSSLYGTTSPWAFFSINPLAGVPSATAPSFVVGSSTATSFIVDNDGDVGVGTTSSYSEFSVNAPAGQDAFAVGSSTKTVLKVNSLGAFFIGTSTAGCAQLSTSGELYSVGSNCGTGGGLSSYDAWTHPVSTYSATTSGIGIGTSTAWAFLGVNPTAGIASRSFAVGSSTGTLFEVENDGRVGVATSSIGTGLMGKFNVDAGAVQTAQYLGGSNNGYLELNIQNGSSGASASSDLIATANNGSATAHYVNLGINGSGGGGTPFTTANDAYLYASDDNLNIGALGSASILTFNTTGGTSPVERARFTAGGDLGIGTTTPYWRLTVASSTGPQVSLSDGSLTNAPFDFRSINNQLYIASSSLTTFATSTPAIFALDNATASTSVIKLSVTGAATSTFAGGVQLKGTLPASSALFVDSNSGVVTSAASSFLAKSLTDETGTGVAVFGTSPTFTTSIAAVPIVNGGSAVGSTLTVQGTSGASPTTASLTLRAASTLSPAMTFLTGGIGIGTTTPKQLLILASSTAPQLTLSSGLGALNPDYAWRVASSTLYLATTSTSTLFPATTTVPILAIDKNGFWGYGTSTPWAKFSFDPGLNVGTTPVLSIGSSSATYLLINNAGNLGVGTSSPWGRITLDRSLGIASSSFIGTQYAPATSTSQSVDCRDANTIYIPTGTGATTITLGQMVAGQTCAVAVVNPNATPGAITWATSASQPLFWSGGTAPTQTTTAAKADLYVFRAIYMSSTATTTPGLKILGAQQANF